MLTMTEILPPVTICPPGKRAYRRPPPAGERVPADPVKESRLSALAEARERASIMAVVRSQPHRRGLADADDKRAGDPLWEYCEKFRVKSALYVAGRDYGAVVRQYRAAIDAPATGLSGPGDGDIQTDGQREAAMVRAKRRRQDADAVLVTIMHRAPSVMADLCCDLRPWRPNDEGLIYNALYRLAVHFKTIDFGINNEKIY